MARHGNDLSYQLMQYSAGSQESLVWLPCTVGDELIDAHSFTISFHYALRVYYMPGTVPISRDTLWKKDRILNKLLKLSYLFIQKYILNTHYMSIPVLGTNRRAQKAPRLVEKRWTRICTTEWLNVNQRSFGRRGMTSLGFETQGKVPGNTQDEAEIWGTERVRGAQLPQLENEKTLISGILWRSKEIAVPQYLWGNIPSCPVDAWNCR